MCFISRIFGYNSLTDKDLFVNFWLRICFWFIRMFFEKKLKRYSKREKEGWELIFEDNFEKNSWEGEDRKWDVGDSWGDFHPHQRNMYKGPPVLSNGYAKFTVKYNPKEFSYDGGTITIPFERSYLSTHSTFLRQYGRWEFRKTLPKEKSAWPASWLYGRGWPPEIDVIEAYGKEDGKSIVSQKINIHWGTCGDTHQQMRAWGVRIKKFSDEFFHEFALEWDENGIYMFTNGIKIYQYTNKRILDKFFNVDTATSRTVINHAVEPDGKGGTKYITPEEEKTYYSEFLVDYVRVYKKIEK